MQECEHLDAQDCLAVFRDRFELPESLIYLDGNSLGPPLKATSARIAQVIRNEWGQDLIGSWNRHGWYNAPQRVGAKIARIIAALPDEVVVADSTSINLFKVAAAALTLRPERRVILSEEGMFPTDLYMLEGLMWQLGKGHSLRLVEPGSIPAAIDESVALVLLQHVSYRSGAVHSMRALTQAAHARGALIIWDLAHSAGMLDVQLGSCNVDFAIGCGYKWLNGGPGAPAFLYVAKRLQGWWAWLVAEQEASVQPLCGWFGHASPFAFEASYSPAPGIQRFLCGTPPILSLAALEVGVDLALEADAAAVAAKSRALGALFQRLMAAECACFGFRLASPGRPEQRGSQICYGHPEGYAIVQALIQEGVVGDFRAPDILRFGFAPLYTRYVDVWAAVQHLKRVMVLRLWNAPEHQQRAAVT